MWFYCKKGFSFHVYWFAPRGEINCQDLLISAQQTGRWINRKKGGLSASRNPVKFVPSFLQREDREHEIAEAEAVKSILKDAGLASPQKM